jgi:threonine aldolase
VQRSIDLRSDTKTLPGDAMRRFMLQAEVGDDESGEDPTVNELQDRAAGLFGKEAALYFPSGTMSNYVALRAQSNPGDEIFIHARSYLLLYGMAGAAALCGLQTRCFDSFDGTLDPATLEPFVQVEEDADDAVTRLAVIEDSFNALGGLVYPIERIRELGAFCAEKGMALHLDGARVFNAAVASGCSVSEIAEPCTTVSVCLSKGLGAPMGSLLLGSAALVSRARRYRTQFGGSMRQVGIMAAGGLYALKHNVPRLADDHRRARRLAELLAAMPGLRVDRARVQTNMVLADTTSSGLTAGEVCLLLEERGVLADPNPYGIRFVTHLDIGDDDVERAAAVVGSVMSAVC